MFIGFLRRTPPPAPLPSACPALEHVLTSERVLLCRPAERDVDAFLASIDDEVRSRQGYDDRAVEGWRKAFLTAAGDTVRCPDHLGVYDQEHGGRFAGIYIVDVAGDRMRASLGWWLGPRSRGRGLGRESLRLVVGYAHSHLRVPVLDLGTAATNERALAQIEAVGAVLVERRPHQFPNGETVESVWFEHRA